MLHLTLRKEFRGRRLKGTAIELTNSSNTGATQIAAADFLEITYPSADALVAIETVGVGHGRPLCGSAWTGQVAPDGDAVPHLHRAGARAQLAVDMGGSARQREARRAAAARRDARHQ